MKFYDVFNGDADGLCALLQLRLASPREATLVTGVKRDIRLLERIEAKTGDDITVVDISMAANRPAMLEALNNGARISWFDHHEPGEIPSHPKLTASIDTDPKLCSSLIVDRHLKGRFRAWAVVAAFGDNLDAPAREAAVTLSLSEDEIAKLRELGMCLNYNAYGELVTDLLHPPAELFLQMRQFAHPREFIREAGVFEALMQGMRDDLDCSDAITVEEISPHCACAVLPEQAWSRRVVGIYANSLAQRHPERAHAVLVARKHGYLVSIRAPLERPRGASRVAGEFHSGGGREGAAGIDFLPDGELEHLFTVMRQIFDRDGA